MHHTLKCDPQTTQDQYACGEWDYLTYNQIHQHTGSLDSTALEHPFFKVGNATPYSVDRTSTLAYDHIQRWERNSSIIQTGSETLTTIGSGNELLSTLFDANNAIARDQYRFSATELTTAGMIAGIPVNQLRYELNTGGGAWWITVRMKHVTANASDRFDDTGFTTVYDANTIFQIDQRLTLHTPFVWDGTSDILIDMAAKSNGTGASANILAADMGSVIGLHQSGADGYADLKNDHIEADATPMAGLGDAITITFRVFGAAEMPVNSTIFEALDANGRRILNIHMPWSDSRIYWDAGNDGSGVDRIDKLATSANIEGQWNNWAFMKNTSTGIMRIYLNGALWHSGTGKTKPMQGIAKWRIGSGVNGEFAYPGKVDEFNVFNTEVSAADIMAWHGKKMNATHPDHSTLIYSYGFDEAFDALQAVNAIDPLSPATLMGTVRRDQHNATLLNSDPVETTIRPNITFVQGDHTLQHDSNLVTVDRPGSLLTIENYEVQGNFAVPVDTVFGALGSWEYTFDPDGAKVDSLYHGGTMHFNDTLHYFGVPFEVVNNFEIGRFITPYGINLSLGPQGFRWTYDVTDYQWLLHDSVELSAGNQQELINLEFELIEGTPPRSVVNHQRPWGQWSSHSYADLDNDVKLPPVTIQLDPAASQWSLRTRFTGHGHNSNTGNYPHCCEWKDNTHYVKVNGAEVDQWHIWQTNDCALNPVYPQGGTWLGSREGWCPGDVVKDHTVELTPVISGTSVELDYDITPVPANNTGMGGGNYVINMDLLEFGEPAFTLDAEILDVQRPSNADYRRRDNPICYDPLVELRNTGGTDLTSVTFTYGVSGGTPLTYNWSGNLKHMQSELVPLPVNNASFWNGDIEHVFTATVSAPNGGNDMHAANDSYSTTFALPVSYTTDVLLHYKTNNRPSENSVTVRDITGAVVFSRNAHTANTTYIDTLNLTDGCYTVEVLDTGNDGFSYWADPSAGSGYFRLKRPSGSTLQTFISEFGRKIYWPFTVATGVGIDEATKDLELTAFPNPSHDQFSIDLGDTQGIAYYTVLNAVGEEVMTGSFATYGKGSYPLDLGRYAEGIYHLRVTTEMGTGSIRLMKQ